MRNNDIPPEKQAKGKVIIGLQKLFELAIKNPPLALSLAQKINPRYFNVYKLIYTQKTSDQTVRRFATLLARKIPKEMLSKDDLAEYDTEGNSKADRLVTELLLRNFPEHMSPEYLDECRNSNYSLIRFLAEELMVPDEINKDGEKLMKEFFPE